MIKSIVWTTLFAFGFTVLQSTVLINFQLFGIPIPAPDLALLVLAYSSYVNGAMVGEVAGFASGVFLDFLSAAPLGLNAFIRTLIGGLAGRLKGAFFLDKFLLPMGLAFVATALKVLVVFILHFIFGSVVAVYHFNAPQLWIELGLNIILAPLLFLLLSLFKPLLLQGRQGN
ncbi:MAG: rod shape-determining protein MreD [Spirochaetaceae bacterium]|nr:rod shape-determining protein MreD [Spirochaetaceae bacterium]